ncbi:oligosaccharide flippase family protein [Candidatus Pacearchaeota archaeon]|nr:oligosaccharide flippase family protein [Candidatus Pacearchaeota archaeon]
MKGSFWLTAGNFVSSAGIFLSAIVFANLIPKEVYGTYKYVLSMAGVLSILSLSGMDSAVMHAVARGYEGSFLPAIKSKISWGLLSTLSSLGLGGYYYFNNNLTLAFSFFLIATFLPFFNTLVIYNSFLQGKKRFDLLSKYKMISQIIAVSLLILVLFLTKNLFLILFVYFASWTILRFVFLKKTIKKFPPNKEIDPETISYGKHSSLIDIIATITTSLDGLLIFHYLGPIELAIYSFALAPILQIKGVLKNVPMLATPKLAQKTTKEINTLLKKRIIALFFAGAVIALVYTLFAPLIYKIFFPKYLDSVFFTQLFSLSVALSLPMNIFGPALTSKLTLTPKKSLYWWTIPSFVFIIFGFLLVKNLGVSGIIIAKLLSSLSVLLVSFFIWNSIKREELRRETITQT